MNIISYTFIGPAKTATSTCAKLFEHYTEYVTSKMYKELYRHSHEYTTYYSKLIPSQNLLIKEYTRLIASGLKLSKQVALFEPSYISLPPEILESLPSDYFVLTLRDPVKRLLSHYSMDISLGLNNLSLLDSLDAPHFYNQYVGLSLYMTLYSRLRERLGDRLIIYDHFERQLYVPKHTAKKQRERVVGDFSLFDYTRTASSHLIINPRRRLRFPLSSRILTSCLQCSQILPSSLKQKIKNILYIQESRAADPIKSELLPDNLQSMLFIEKSSLHRALDDDCHQVSL